MLIKDIGAEVKAIIAMGECKERVKKFGDKLNIPTYVCDYITDATEKAYEVSANILKEFKCKNIEQLRKIPAKKLVKTKYSNSEMMLDGYALTKDPYQVYLDPLN